MYRNTAEMYLTKVNTLHTKMDCGPGKGSTRAKIHRTMLWAQSWVMVCKQSLSRYEVLVDLWTLACLSSAMSRLRVSSTESSSLSRPSAGYKSR